MEDQEGFQEKVKNSFLNVKRHMDSLEREINELKKEIQELKAQSTNFWQKTPKKEGSPQEMKGSKHSFIHSFIHSFTHSLVDYSHLSDVKKLEKTLKTLTKREFYIFLVIYQLEEDLNRELTYQDLQQHTKLSFGCIRSYISNLIKKGMPLLKNTLDDKTIILTIDKGFRDLGLKSKIIDIYNQRDPNKRRLSDP